MANEINAIIVAVQAIWHVSTCGKHRDFASIRRIKTPQDGRTNFEAQRGRDFGKGNVKEKSRGNRVRCDDKLALPPLRDPLPSTEFDSAMMFIPKNVFFPP